PRGPRFRSANGGRLDRSVIRATAGGHGRAPRPRGDRAAVMAKLKKPSAIECLDDIVRLSDGIMIARGDLGVEMRPEQVPVIQRQILRACRAAGKPVIVATQMLESMISAPTPTRAEASDVATAIYDGA